jgi:DNA-binding XRE family transcriptional regulator
MAILLLRTAKCNQESVADYLGCGKQKIVAVEKWFRNLHYEDAISVCFDNAVACAFVTELNQVVGLLEQTKNKLEKLDATAVLMRYCHVKVKGPRAPSLHPRPSVHHARLAVAAEKLRLNIKAVKNIKGAVLVGDITRGYIQTKTSEKNELQDVDRLDATCLLTHLQAMYPDFHSIGSWESLNTTKSVRSVSGDLRGKLKLVSHGLALQGTCEICQSWGGDSGKE